MGIFNSGHYQRTILLLSISLILMLHVNCGNGLNVLLIENKSSNLFTAWTGSITITIDSAKVASDLTNFPVLISFPNNASLMGNAKPDGSDIFFADETMTKLDHEIEKYDNSTGELVAWVRVPLLSSSTDTDIHLYYGNLSSPDQSNKTGVWDANYLAVLHMNNDPAVPAGPGGDQIKDSSLNSNHFSNDFGLTSGDSVNAYIGKGLNMVAKPIERNGALSQPSSVTLSAWVNFIGVLPGKGGGEVINISNVWGIRLSSGGTDNFYWHQLLGFNWNGIGTTPPAPIAGTGWHHVVATFDNDGHTQKLYVDGILKASGTFLDSVVYEWSHRTAIGKHADNDLYDYNGTIDETRISDIPRSEEWIQTEYNNQSSPSTFYSVW